MLDQTFECLTDSAAGALPLHAIRPEGLADLLAALNAPQAAFLTGAGFKAKAQELVLLPGANGVAAPSPIRRAFSTCVSLAIRPISNICVQR